MTTEKTGVSASNRMIVNKAADKQLVYCVVLEPNTEDLQGDVIEAAEIERAAHEYMTHSRTIFDSHKSYTDAVPVESWIAPVDVTVDGEVIKQGSWVITIKVLAPAMWEAVKSGAYTGVSIGGMAVREEL